MTDGSNLNTEQERLDYYYDKLLKEFDSIKPESMLCGTEKCPGREFNDSKQGCCKNCGKHNGFFTYEPHNKENLIVLKDKYKFDTILGFFEEGKGCKLPRKLRSMTCTSWFCEDMSMNIDRHKIVLICRKITSIKQNMKTIY